MRGRRKGRCETLQICMVFRARRRKGEPSARLQSDLGRGSGKLAGDEARSAYKRSRSRSIYQIDSLVPTEIKMMEIGKRSIFIGRMKLKDAFVAASKVDDLVTAWRQRFAENSSGRLTDRGGMEFYEGDMAMVCNVDEERRSGLRKRGARRKRACNYRYQAADSQIQLKHSSSHSLFPSIDAIGSVGWAIVTTPSPRSDRGPVRIYLMCPICFLHPLAADRPAWTRGPAVRRSRARRVGIVPAMGRMMRRGGDPSNVMPRSAQHRG